MGRKRIIEFTYTDKSTETFENVSNLSFENGKYLVEVDGYAYTVNIGDVISFRELNQDKEFLIQYWIEKNDQAVDLEETIQAPDEETAMEQFYLLHPTQIIKKDIKITELN